MKTYRNSGYTRFAVAVPSLFLALVSAHLCAAPTDTLDSGGVNYELKDRSGASSAELKASPTEVQSHVALAEEPVPYSYYRNGNGVVIYEYTGNAGEVVIPGTIQGLPVIAIKNPGVTDGFGNPISTFLGRESLTSVSIPASVAEIEHGVFNGCVNLASIEVDAANAVYSSWQGIMYDKARTSLILCPSAMAGSVVIPSGVTTIGASAFRRCSKLASIILPSGLTIIDSSAFLGCSRLENMTIPNSVTVIQNSAFQECTSLHSVSLPNHLTKIGEYTFWLCSNLTKVIIPDGVDTIGTSAFEACRSLQTIRLPDSITGIGPRAFLGTGLKGITIPPYIQYLQFQVFSTCWKLGKVSMPEGLDVISDGAFEDCINLKSVAIPDSVRTIGEGAFYGCAGITHLKMPERVSYIGHAAFQGCRRLSKVTFAGNAPELGHEQLRPEVVFKNTAPRFTLYYNPKSSGFSTPLWSGYRAKPFFAVYDTTGPQVGVKREFRNNENVRFGVIGGGIGLTDQARIEKRFSIENTGDAPIARWKIRLKGKQAEDFRILKSPAKSLQSGQKSAFTVVYQPKMARTSKATLEITSNLKVASPFRIRIEGKGLK